VGQGVVRGHAGRSLNVVHGKCLSERAYSRRSATSGCARQPASGGQGIPHKFSHEQRRVAAPEVAHADGSRQAQNRHAVQITGAAC